MLKKLMCLLLVLACSAALFACGDSATVGNVNSSENGTQTKNPVTTEPGDAEEPTDEKPADKELVSDKTEVDSAREQTFFAVVNNSQPNVIVTQSNTTHSKLGTCTGYYRTTIYGDDYYSFYYEYEKFNAIGEGSSIVEKVPANTIYYKDGKYSYDNETWIYDHPDPAVLNVKLDLNKQYLGDYVISSDGTQLSAKVSAADAEKILGVKITATSKVSITVKTDGTHLWVIEIDYTNNDTQVKIATSYTYEIISADAQ